MNAQAITLVGGLALSQLARRINMDTPERVWALRVLYLSVHALIFAMYLYIARKIRNKNDNTLLKYVETKPFSSQTGEPPAVTITTVRNYDLLEVSKAMRGLVTGIGMTLFMHFWLLFNQPLAISSLTVWLQIYRSNMVRIHLRGQEAKNDLKRPFNANAPAGFMGGGGPATDKASIEAAEKANLLHRKEEF